MNELIAQGLAQHWHLGVAGWWLWRWIEGEKKQRIEADRQRKEDERTVREEHRKVTGEVVREELAMHLREEAATFAQIREAIAGIAALVRQHDDRLRELEKRP